MSLLTNCKIDANSFPEAFVPHIHLGVIKKVLWGLKSVKTNSIMCNVKTPPKNITKALSDLQSKHKRVYKCMIVYTITWI